ncbi:MAG: TMEM175 family protein [Candidatus Sulfotelmatobacter sp.]
MGHRSRHDSPREQSSQHVSDNPDGHGFPSEHRRGLLPEPYFRWRGGEITRLEAFCDVVFGFALTLLVVSLEVPRNYAELMAALRGFAPFAVCFALLILVWRAHYQFSRRYGLEDPYTVVLNLVLLFVVLFYVYPLKYVFTMVFSQVTGSNVATIGTLHEASVLMRVYAAGFVAVFLLFGLMYMHAYKLRHALGLDEVEVLETRASLQQNAIMVVTGAVSFLLALTSPALAGWWYFVLGPALGIHGAIYGRRVRLLAEKTRGN